MYLQQHRFDRFILVKERAHDVRLKKQNFRKYFIFNVKTNVKTLKCILMFRKNNMKRKKNKNKKND